MKINNKLSFVLLVLFVLAGFSSVFATQPQIAVNLTEFVNQNVSFNPLKVGGGIWFDAHENQSFYNLTGYITISNRNLNNQTISDIYILLNNTQNITLPKYYDGRNGIFILNNTGSGSLLLHIPELLSGQNSTWIYKINRTSIRPPLNFTSNYSNTKVLAGSNITVTDKVQNTFDNLSFQKSTCINNIIISQVTQSVNFSGVPQYFYFYNTTPATLLTSGIGAVNVVYPNDTAQNWNILAGACLNKTNETTITYKIKTPHNIPKTTNYPMIISTLKYQLNNTISHLEVSDIKAVSAGSIGFDKKIEKPSDPLLYGSNVTWNITAFFNTSTNITYNLSGFTMWVAKRSLQGNPNSIANDSISGVSLYKSSNPYTLVNITSPWFSPSWFFNYSDLPTPIVWAKANFSIANYGNQLISRNVTRNGKDLYIKEIYLIIGYWLEVTKNITSVGNNTYNINITVHNKGNQVTPADSPVTVYDFIPERFNVTSSFNFAVSPWFSTSSSNISVNGSYNGTLFRWGLIPTNILNTSFAAGPSYNANTTWSVDFNITGNGNYKVTDVFITGLDPQKVEGAGTTSSVVISEVLNKLKSSEGIFAGIASILLLFGLLL